MALSGKRAVAHLLRRAGLGASEAELEEYTALGFEGAVERLVNFESIPDPVAPPAFRLTPQKIEELRAADGGRGRLREEQRRQLRQMARQDLLDLGRWWLSRLVATPRPLQEKMTLFWHGHFATSARKVRVGWLLWQQNELFRSKGLGSFTDLALAVSRDPAMMIYLDSQQNRKEHPNENFARELMELFTLGRGNYTETDVKEAARAFTGWGVERSTGKFRFLARQHDAGSKTVLGRSGPLDGDDVVRACCAQPACASFLARKLFCFFVYPDPEPDLVERHAAAFRQSGLDLRSLVRNLLLSPEFRSERAWRALVKSPVELVVGTLRALGASPPDLLEAGRLASRMGQTLFAPPSVKGWDGGPAWLSSSTMFDRFNAGGALLQMLGERLSGPPPASAQEAVDRAVAVLLAGEASPATRKAALDYAASLSGLPAEVRYRLTLALVAASPDYQLA
jgi:uncharacterized protein (DUF1800 family)